MTKTIQQRYVQARADEINRREARRICTRVQTARKTPHDAGLRWPFELLQNALDAGPREGRTEVSITLSSTEDRVIFQHDGKPFSLQELDALLSGGSSKESESEVQTGRYGTGFLVTHVLAERTELTGLISDEGCWEFRLTLDRAGDEEAILRNIKQCERDLGAVTLAENIDKVPSARFEYSVDAQTELHLGLNAFLASLPYLFATRTMLGPVTVTCPGETAKKWTPQPEQRQLIGDGPGMLIERSIKVTNNKGRTTARYRILRFQLTKDSRAACHVLLVSDGKKWRFCEPHATLPRIFREYPIRGSVFVPTNFVIDGKFEATPERDRIAMNSGDEELLSAAFEAATLAVGLAATEEWEDRHLLCSFGPTVNSFSGSQEEVGWWRTQLLNTATAIASMPVVATRRGNGPAISVNGEWYADFPLPRLDDASKGDETTIGRLWPLVNEAKNLYPPIKELSTAWNGIVTGWAGLGVPIHQITVKKLAEFARQDASNISELKVTTDGQDWLARFMDVLGECWQRRVGSDP